MILGKGNGALAHNLSLVAIVVMAGILAYGATQATDMPMRCSTISQPGTTA